MLRKASIIATAIAAGASCADAQSGKRSQLATVTQLVGPAKIEIIYRRPVARGRELFGKLVPFGKVWTPSADSAAVFITSVDLDINGSTLKKGRYAVWMIPESSDWTIIFSSKHAAFHLVLPEKSEEILRVTSKAQSADHMETLGFYFPIVDADSATLNMHWGKTAVPIRIKAK